MLAYISVISIIVRKYNKIDQIITFFKNDVINWELTLDPCAINCNWKFESSDSTNGTYSLQIYNCTQDFFSWKPSWDSQLSSFAYFLLDWWMPISCKLCMYSDFIWEFICTMSSHDLWSVCKQKLDCFHL